MPGRIMVNPRIDWNKAIFGIIQTQVYCRLRYLKLKIIRPVKILFHGNVIKILILNFKAIVWCEIMFKKL